MLFMLPASGFKGDRVRIPHVGAGAFFFHLGHHHSFAIGAEIDHAIKDVVGFGIGSSQFGGKDQGRFTAAVASGGAEGIGAGMSVIFIIAAGEDRSEG